MRSRSLFAVLLFAALVLFPPSGFAMLGQPEIACYAASDYSALAPPGVQDAFAIRAHDVSDMAKLELMEVSNQGSPPAYIASSAAAYSYIAAAPQRQDFP